MCSSGVFFETWLSTCTSVSSTCSGVFPRSLESWVSVAIFVGIRFSSAILSGLISWVRALVSVITKMFSPSSVLRAGRLLGIFIGTREPPRYQR